MWQMMPKREGPIELGQTTLDRAEADMDRRRFKRGGPLRGLQSFGVTRRRFIRLASFLMLILGACVARAEQAGEGPAPEPGDVYLPSSRVYIFVGKTGFGHEHGVEGRLKAGALKLGAEKDAGELVFDMKTFVADGTAARRYVGLEGTTDAGTRAAVTKNMLSKDVLDVGRYPTAKFEIESAVATNRKTAKGLPLYQLRGKFTLHGRTRPLEVLAEVEQVRGWLHVRGSFGILQTAFGITPYSKAFGAVGVTDELKIYGDFFVAPSTQVDLAGIPEHS